MKHFDNYKLNVKVDPEIVNYYRSLIPSKFKINKQMYAPHITVVRNEVPLNLEAWGRYEGELIGFEYDNEIQIGQVYWWLNCYCTRLEEIRLELGLGKSSEYSRPPDDKECFHITIGNTKR